MIYLVAAWVLAAVFLVVAHHRWREGIRREQRRRAERLAGLVERARR